jgi:hypothetical protein
VLYLIDPSHAPRRFVVVVLANNFRGNSKHHGVVRNAPGNDRISRYNAVTPDPDLASRANDGGSMANPGAFSDADCAAIGYALSDNWCLDVFVRVVVVHDQDLLGHVNIPFKVDPVPGGHNAAKGDYAIVVDDNRGISCWIVSRDIEPRILTDGDGVAKPDSGSALTAHLARAMKRDAISDGSERIRHGDPEAVQPGS